MNKTSATGAPELVGHSSRVEVEQVCETIVLKLRCDSINDARLTFERLRAELESGRLNLTILIEGSFRDA